MCSFPRMRIRAFGNPSLQGFLEEVLTPCFRGEALCLGRHGSPSFRGFLLACDRGEGVYCRYVEERGLLFEGIRVFVLCVNLPRSQLTISSSIVRLPLPF